MNLRKKNSAKNDSEEESAMDFFVDSPKLFEAGNTVLSTNELSELLDHGIIETKELAELNDILEYMLTRPSAQQMADFGAQKQDKWNELRQNDDFNGMLLGSVVVICIHSADFWLDHQESNIKISQQKILPYVAADVVGAALSFTYDLVTDGVVSGSDIPGTLIKGAVLGSVGAALGVACWVKSLF